MNFGNNIVCLNNTTDSIYNFLRKLDIVYTAIEEIGIPKEIILTNDQELTNNINNSYIYKIFYGGKYPVYEVEFSDKSRFEFSGHQELMICRKNSSIWKNVNEIEYSDDIMKFGTNEFLKIKNIDYLTIRKPLWNFGCNFYLLSNGLIAKGNKHLIDIQCSQTMI